MVTREELLRQLPEYIGASVVIKKNQDVGDIIHEVLESHRSFTSYYDRLAPWFDADTVAEICDNLQTFCATELKYRAETIHDQTTAIPAGILERGSPSGPGIDCKHYASFCGGILSAITRTTGRRIDWVYRFVSYKILEPSPYHVFVVVFDGGREIWIDPTPGADKLTPVWITDKQIKNSSMPLRRIIAGLESGSERHQMGAVDPIAIYEAAMAVVNFVKKFVGDQVPNYPIKKQSTLEKLQAEVAASIPLPPTSVENAKVLYQKAILLRDQKALESGDAAKSISMMYGEVAAALQQYIAIQSPSDIDPVTGQPRTTKAGISPALLWVGAGAAAWFLWGATKKQKSVHGVGKVLPILAIGAGLYFLARRGSVSAKRKALEAWGSPGESGAEKFAMMTDAEINSVWEFKTDYIDKGTYPPVGSRLYNEIQAISAKYDIFS